MDVKTLCLGVLERGDATGYEIKRQCEEGPYADVCPAGFGCRKSWPLRVWAAAGSARN